MALERFTGPAINKAERDKRGIWERTGQGVFGENEMTFEPVKSGFNMASRTLDLEGHYSDLGRLLWEHIL